MLMQLRRAGLGYWLPWRHSIVLRKRRRSSVKARLLKLAGHANHRIVHAGMTLRFGLRRLRVDLIRLRTMSESLSHRGSGQVPPDLVDESLGLQTGVS